MVLRVRQSPSDLRDLFCSGPSHDPVFQKNLQWLLECSPLSQTFHLCPDAFPTSLTPSTSIVFQNNSLSCSSSSRLSPPPLRPFPLQCPHAFLGGAALEAPARTPGASVRAPSPCHHWMACFYPQWMMRTRFHHCSQGPAL